MRTKISITLVVLGAGFYHGCQRSPNEIGDYEAYDYKCFKRGRSRGYGVSHKGTFVTTTSSHCIVAKCVEIHGYQGKWFWQDREKVWYPAKDEKCMEGVR